MVTYSLIQQGHHTAMAPCNSHHGLSHPRLILPSVHIRFLHPSTLGRSAPFSEVKTIPGIYPHSPMPLATHNHTTSGCVPVWNSWIGVSWNQSRFSRHTSVSRYVCLYKNLLFTQGSWRDGGAIVTGQKASHCWWGKCHSSSWPQIRSQKREKV